MSDVIVDRNEIIYDLLLKLVGNPEVYSVAIARIEAEGTTLSQEADNVLNIASALADKYIAQV